MPYFFFEGFVYDFVKKYGKDRNLKAKFMIGCLLMYMVLICLICLFQLSKGLLAFLKLLLIVEVICIPFMIITAFWAWKIYDNKEDKEP